MPVRTIQYLNDADAAALAEPVLRRVFAPNELQSLKVWSEIDFDGEEVLRVLAILRAAISGADLLNAIHAVRNELREKGDERYVLMTARKASAEVDGPPLS